jgi:hypothetical protein
MSALAFDTHAFIKRLTAAGMPEAQAEILADQQTKLIDEKLVTKVDLAGLRADLAATAAALRADLAATAAALRADLAATAAALRADLAATAAALKADLATTETALRAEIVKLDNRARETELRLEMKIESVKSDLVKWMFGTVGFQTLVIIGAVIALAPVVHP